MAQIIRNHHKSPRTLWLKGPSPLPMLSAVASPRATAFEKPTTPLQSYRFSQPPHQKRLALFDPSEIGEPSRRNGHPPAVLSNRLDSQNENLSHESAVPPPPRCRKSQRRGYSLVAVLAALLILMAVLVPLMHLQGNLFQSHTGTDRLTALQAIRQDLDQLEAEGKPPGPKTWKIASIEIQRTVTPQPNHLYQLHYTTTQSQKTIVELTAISYAPP